MKYAVKLSPMFMKQNQSNPAVPSVTVTVNKGCATFPKTFKYTETLMHMQNTKLHVS